MKVINFNKKEHGCNALTPLQEGDVVDVIAPSSGVSRKIFNDSIKFLECLGLKARVKPFEECISKAHFYCANEESVRAEHLAEAFVNRESKAIWCLAGGYGAYQLLDRLQAIAPPKNKKIVIGFSDHTVLLNHVADKWHWPVLYAPPLKQMVDGSISERAKKQLIDVLFGKTKKITLENVQALNGTAKHNNKEIHSTIVGGCASLFQSLIGTPQQVNTDERVLLLEDDSNETAPRLDRIFNHIDRARLFEQCTAVLFGNFIDGKKTDAKKAEALGYAVKKLSEKLDAINVPLLQCSTIGHMRDMVTLPLMAATDIILGTKPKITVAVAGSE